MPRTERVEHRESQFAELVSEYGRALMRVAAAYTRAAADREDLYQEILFALWRAMPRFRGDASTRTYVYRIAHNRGITWRARGNVDVPSLDELSEPVAPDTPADVASERAEEYGRLLDAVRGLRPAYRQVIMLQLEGLATAEIAEVIGVSANVVNVRAHRARELLRETLTHSRSET